eukprot:gene3138-5454_t
MQFLVFVFLFTFVSNSYQNIPAVSCQSVETLDLFEGSFEPGPPESCHSKSVCKMSCLHLDPIKFKNSTYNRTFDLTSYYNSDIISQRTYDLTCLTRLFSTGIDDWTDVASIMFRDLVKNVTKSPSDVMFLNTTCPEMAQLEPNVEKLRKMHPDTLLEKGFTYDQIITCFGDFDTKYFNWSSHYNGLNFTQENNFVEWSSVKAIQYYKDAMVGFQELCGQLYGNGSFLPPGSFPLLDMKLIEFENSRVSEGLFFQNEKERKTNYMYQFSKLQTQIPNDKKDLLFESYNMFRGFFIQNVFSVERRYCRCETIKLLSDVFKSDMNKTGNGTYPSVTTTSNMQNVTHFSDLMVELCTNIASPKSSPKVSPNPYFSPKVSPQASPMKTSYIPSISPRISAQSSPKASNSPVLTPSTSNQPKESPKVSQMRAIVSNYPNNSPKMSPIVSPKESKMKPTASKYPNNSPRCEGKKSKTYNEDQWIENFSQ